MNSTFWNRPMPSHVIVWKPHLESSWPRCCSSGFHSLRSIARWPSSPWAWPCSHRSSQYLIIQRKWRYAVPIKTGKKGGEAWPNILKIGSKPPSVSSESRVGETRETWWQQTVASTIPDSSSSCSSARREVGSASFIVLLPSALISRMAVSKSVRCSKLHVFSRVPPARHMEPGCLVICS